MSDGYPYIQVSGTPYEMGVQHGEQAGDRVRHFLEMIVSDAVQGDVSQDEVLGRTAAFRPLFEAAAPDLMEEVWPG